MLLYGINLKGKHVTAYDKNKQTGEQQYVIACDKTTGKNTLWHMMKQPGGGMLWHVIKQQEKTTR